MPIRTVEAEWHGTLRDGQGTMQFAGYSGPFSFASRFEEGSGTNPEALIGAAHAGCFSMQLAGNLAKAGYTAERIHTRALVHLDKSPEGFTITEIELHSDARVRGIDAQAFQQHAQDAKQHCPVSRALAGVHITLEARLA